jgi:hypothetical protein
MPLLTRNAKWGRDNFRSCRTKRLAAWQQIEIYPNPDLLAGDGEMRREDLLQLGIV